MPFTYSIANGVAFGLITLLPDEAYHWQETDVRRCDTGYFSSVRGEVCIYDVGINSGLMGRGGKTRLQNQKSCDKIQITLWTIW